MKRTMIAVLALLVALPLSAGVTYQFKSATDIKGNKDMQGAAFVDGTNMRIEFEKGDGAIFKDASTVISRDGGKTLLVLDPKEKSYYEINLPDLFNTVGNAMKAMGGMFTLSLANQKVEVTDAGDGGPMEGYPTRKYVVESSYDMTLKVMGMGSTSNIQSVTETWATDRLAAELMTFVQLKSLRTGVEDFDKLIEAQTKAVKGFPLKQVTKTITTANGKKPQTNTTTVTITGVKNLDVAKAKFEVPKDYKKGESPLAGLEGLKQ